MSTRRLALAGLCVALLGEGARAQSSGATLVVIATDAVRGVPLPFVDVAIASRRRERLADDRGIAKFTGLDAGTVEVRVRRVGFIPARRSITLAGNDTLRVALEHLTFTLPPVVSRDAICPGRPVGDTATLAILEQMRINAERARLMSEQFPFSSRVERILSEAGSDRRIDTILVSGLMSWKYGPGKLVVPSTDPRDRGADQLLLPQLVHLASDEFLQYHCFRYAGRRELDDSERLRIDFEPVKSLREADVTGSIWLDTLTYRLVAMSMEMDRPINSITGRTIRVDTKYVDILPGIPIPQQTCARTTISLGSSLTSVKQYMLEWQRTLGVVYVTSPPEGAGAVAPGVVCRR